MYKFRRGMIPTYRQMFYQLCDIDVPEVHTLVNANAGKVCLLLLSVPGFGMYSHLLYG